MEPATTALVILAAVIVLYVTEVIPLPLTSIAGCMAMVLFGVVDFSEAFSGFSANAVFLVGGMMLVGNALFQTGGAQAVGDRLRMMGQASERRMLIIIMLIGGVMSAVISNSATTALMMSVVFGIASGRERAMQARRMLMPLAFASNSGGMLTLVASTPPIIVQEALVDAGYAPLGFFEFALIGMPVFVFTIAYVMTAGYWQLNRMSQHRKRELEQQVSEAAAAYDTGEGREVERDPFRMKLTFAILALCVVLFATQVIPAHLTAIVGAWLVLVTGCIKFRSAFRSFDWQTIVVLAGSLGIARGIRLSGAAELLADQVLHIGFADQPMIILGIFIAIGMLLTQVVSNTAATAVMAPIGIFLAQGIGVSPYPLMLGLCTLTAAGFATPVATPPNTMVLIAGYRFRDYLTIGGPLNLAILAIATLVVPLIWPF